MVSDALEKIKKTLNVPIPSPYLTFLKTHRSGIFQNCPILGLPTEAVPMPVTKATLMLRSQRSDLSLTLIPICLKEEKALCMDLTDGDQDDPPLVEVSLTEGVDPVAINRTVGQYLDLMTRSEGRVELGIKRLEDLREENRGWQAS